MLKIVSFLRKLVICVIVLCSLLLTELVFGSPNGPLSTPLAVFVFKYQKVITNLMLLSYILWAIIKFWDFLMKFFAVGQKVYDECLKDR